MDATATPRRTGAATVGLLALAHFIVSVDFNIVYIALPEIGRSLGFSAQGLQWVVSAFALGYGGLLLLGGRAADRLGARRVFVAGLLVFALASIAGALAQASWVLVAARGGQGLGAALLFPSSVVVTIVWRSSLPWSCTWWADPLCSCGPRALWPRGLLSGARTATACSWPRSAPPMAPPIGFAAPYPAAPHGTADTLPL
jgi:MFS family permease